MDADLVPFFACVYLLVYGIVVGIIAGTRVESVGKLAQTTSWRFVLGVLSIVALAFLVATARSSFDAYAEHQTKRELAQP